jgi:hypothetical protein
LIQRKQSTDDMPPALLEYQAFHCEMAIWLDSPCVDTVLLHTIVSTTNHREVNFLIIFAQFLL